MIESIRIVDFQSHERTEVGFGPVTTIVGPSDVGKSAIIRAFRWLVSNRPSGEEFIRWGADGCRVMLKVDGKIVTRAKGPENLYRLDGREFKAFGQDVPLEVSNTLQMGELNFQEQLSSPFWFGLSAGEVSRQLNSVVDLSVIDDVLQGVSKAVREAQQLAALASASLQESSEKKIQTKWAVAADAELQSLEDADAELQDLRGKADSLVEIQEQIQEQSAVFERESIRVKDLNALGRSLSEIRSLQGQQGLLSSFIREFKEVQVSSEKKIPDLTRINAQLVSIQALTSQKRAYDTITGDIRRAQSSLDLKGSELERAEAILQEKTDGVCPICGGEL